MVSTLHRSRCRVLPVFYDRLPFSLNEMSTSHFNLHDHHHQMGDLLTSLPPHHILTVFRCLLFGKRLSHLPDDDDAEVYRTWRDLRGSISVPGLGRVAHITTCASRDLAKFELVGERSISENQEIWECILESCTPSPSRTSFDPL